MEIGSFIELQIPRGMEYYKGNKWANMDIVRLNSGRVAIYHAFTATKCKKIWLPLYQCETVREFLVRKGVAVRYYHIDSSFNPVGLMPSVDDSVLIVNYYGVMSKDRMRSLVQKYKNVIIDNSQAFFAEPIEGCINVYSARKFIGVPDGAYVIGENILEGVANYKQGFSSDTALFLLQRIEYGCEGKSYISRTENEKRIDREDCCRMSKLTHYLLDGTDYLNIRNKRRENFEYAYKLFEKINRIYPKIYYDKTCVPMVYPLLIEDDKLLEKMLRAKHFQGHWWKWVEISEVANKFEKWVSKYMIPITIDQRYGVEELDYLKNVVMNGK